MSTKRKPPTRIAQPVVKQSAKKPIKTHINEADTAVSAPTISSKTGNGLNEEVIEISSDSGSSEYELLSDEEKQNNGEPSATSNGAIQHTEAADGQNAPRNSRPIPDETGDVDMDMPSPNQPTDGESDQEPAAPTFGDLVRANETIDVPSALSAQQSSALATAGRAVAPPSSSSLGTVLAQALRTDDTDLLESCLHTTDLATVRNTIQRLDSTLAGILLTKLAARMHRRPGRAGSLMTWVQWTLIAHGGALAMQPGLTKKLSELHRVLEERSRGLNSLLALKGKLDLLDAQMQLRRGMQHNIDSDEDEDEDGEEGVVYVEGEDSDAEVIINGDMGTDGEDLVVTNGIVDMDDESDGEESSEGEEDEEQLEGEDEIDENEVDHEDVESEEEESEPEAVPPSKRSRTTQSARTRR